MNRSALLLSFLLAVSCGAPAALPDSAVLINPDEKSVSSPVVLPHQYELMGDLPVSRTDAVSVLRRLNVFGVEAQIINAAENRIMLSLSSDVDPALIQQILLRAQLRIEREGDGDFIVTEENVRTARVTQNSNEELSVTLLLTPEGAERIHDLTVRYSGQVLTISVDNVVISMPEVLEPIEGFEVTISSGVSDPDGSLKLRVLAARLGSEPLAANWTVRQLD